MSRTPAVAPPRPLPQFTEADEARRLTYSVDPSVRGWDGAVDFTREEWGVIISTAWVKKLVYERRLPRYVISGIIHFAPRDLFTVIILGTRRTGAVRKPRNPGPTTAV